MNIKKFKNFSDFISIFLYGGNLILNKFLAFVIIILITKYFSQEIVGQYFLFLTIQSLIVTISISGIPHLYTKELSFNFINNINLMTAYKIILFSIIISLIIFIILSLVSLFIYANENYIFLILISTFLTILNSIFFYIYLAQKKINLGNFIDQTLKNILIILTLCLVIFLKYYIDIYAIILLYISSNFIVLILFILDFFKKKKNSFENCREKIEKYKYFKFFFITGLSSIFTVANSKIDLLMIDFFLNKIEVGLYGIGNQIAFMFYLPTVVFTHILMPKISNLLKKKKNKKLNLILDFYRLLLFCIKIIIFLISLFIINYFIILFFGENYLPSSSVFKIIVIGYLLGSLMSFNDVYSYYSNKESKVTFVLFVSSIINILLNFYLIPIFGINGAAIALSVSHVSFVIMSSAINYENNFYFKKIIFVIFSKKNLLKKLLSS